MECDKLGDIPSLYIQAYVITEGVMPTLAWRFDESCEMLPAQWLGVIGSRNPIAPFEPGCLYREVDLVYIQLSHFDGYTPNIQSFHPRMTGDVMALQVVRNNETIFTL